MSYFCMDTKDLNSGSHAHLASTYPLSHLHSDVDRDLFSDFLFFRFMPNTSLLCPYNDRRDPLNSPSDSAREILLVLDLKSGKLKTRWTLKTVHSKETLFINVLKPCMLTV